MAEGCMGIPFADGSQVKKIWYPYKMTDQNKYYPLTEEELRRKKLGGMTVNERLSETGQMEAYEKAEKQKDKKTIREILLSVYVDEASIKRIIEKL